MDKVIKDGKVAVLVSPGFGAGWFTWNTGRPECLYTPRIVEAVLAGRGDIEAIAEEFFHGEGFWGGADQLQVEWVPVGTRFRINEYDGSESITLEDDEVWQTA